MSRALRDLAVWPSWSDGGIVDIDRARGRTRVELGPCQMILIAQIMRALGSGPDDIEGAVVHWLGKRLYAAYEVLEAEP